MGQEPGSQARTFEFRIRCANRHESCSAVRAMMSDFVIRDAPDGEIHDHIGIRAFEKPSLAVKRSRELLKEAGNDIKNLIIVRI